MKYGINTKYIAKSTGIENAAKLIGNAGFKFLDYTPNLEEDWEKLSHDAVELFNKHNLSVYQTHAPFYRYSTNSAEQHQAEVFNTLKATSIMGAKYLVIHGDEFDFNQFYTNKAALEYNYEHFAPVVEKAAELGVNIAFENLFEDRLPDRPRFCSYTEQLVELIDKFNSPHVCCCWDFGHASVTYGKKQHDAIKMLGKRIRCTHIHDNIWHQDLHLVPFMGEIDWNTCMSALKKYGDTEVLSLEFAYGKILESCAEDFVNMLYKTCVELDSI